MACGPLCRTREKKNYPETDESGSFWISTLIDMDSRLRVCRGVGKNETEASLKVFQTLKQRGHPDGPFDGVAAAHVLGGLGFSEKVESNGHKSMRGQRAARAAPRATVSASDSPM